MKVDAQQLGSDSMRVGEQSTFQLTRRSCISVPVGHLLDTDSNENLTIQGPVLLIA